MENTALLVLLICWLIFVGISIFYCFKCFKPNMVMSYDKNVFFFSDAVNKFEDTENYTKELLKICDSEENLYQLLAEQVHAESKIINAKFKNVQKSIAFFGISFLFVILTTLYWFLFT